MKIEHASSFSRLLWTSRFIHSGLFCDGKIASLAYLVGRLSSRPDWLDTELRKADLIGLLAKDVDGSAEIAEHWLTRLKELLDQR